jgi:hypothetical protein
MGDKWDAGPGLGFVKCSAFTRIPGIAEATSNTITPNVILVGQLDRLVK